jgi:hypothetical protein
MTIPNFQLGYPPDGSNLGNTKLQMRNNIDGTILTLSVDHQNANQTTPGYHTVIHQVTQASTPSARTGVNQLFSKVATIPNGGDTQLFSLTGGGGLTQLTGNYLPSVPSQPDSGFAWTGGLLIQWGQVSSITNGTVAFNNNPATYNFPNNCYFVTTQPYWVGVTQPNGAAGVSVKSISTTGFTWVFNTNSSAYTGGGFYWIAVGN